MTSNFKASDEELRQKFFLLENPRDIADLLEIEYSALIYNLFKKPEEKRYKEFEIRKRSGGIRHISVPNAYLQFVQRKLNHVLSLIYTVKGPVQAYVPQKSIVTNAQMHSGKRYVLNLDLRGFFPSITFRRVRGMFEAVPYNRNEAVSVILARICCHQNSLPQGASTSPVISNMICAKMDSQLRRLAVKNRCVYTRYADDLTFSTSLKKFPESLAQIVNTENGNEVVVGLELHACIKENGFWINSAKTRLQTFDRRQEVTGLTVNRFPNVTRRYISQIRAMLYYWENDGLEKAEKDHHLYFSKDRNPQKKPPSFAEIVRGKIEFLGMVRGKDNLTYLKFLGQLAELAPELVGDTHRDIIQKREKIREQQEKGKLINALKKGFDMGELKLLCFGLDLDFENVKQPSKEETIIALYTYYERRKEIEKLADRVKEERPNYFS